MRRNPHNSKTAHLKAVRTTKFHPEQHRSDASKACTSVAAITRAAEAPDLQTFIKVIDECKQQVKSTQDQLTLLALQNAGLQQELIALTQSETQARHLAHHDALTGLPNRSLLHDRFHQVLSQAQRYHKPLALLMLDLDQFKLVNDKLGHASGDKLLHAVAQRLIKGIRGADTACRYGGDEFALLLSEIDNPSIATTLAEEICGRLSRPYIIEGHHIHISVSVGVAVYPGDGQTFEELMRQADSAMYRIKGMGNGTTTAITALSKENNDPGKNIDPLASHYTNHLRVSKLFTLH